MTVKDTLALLEVCTIWAST